MKGYKVGDRVVCIGKADYSWFKNLTIDKIYEITEESTSTNGFDICYDIVDSWTYAYDLYFIPIERYRSEVIDEILK
mgnify:CR=1 FL=1